MSTHIYTAERNRWFRDRDGVLSVCKEEDSVEPFTLDYADELASGETISTSTWDCDGVTATTSSNTTTSTSVTLSGSTGTAENTVTTSAGRTLVRRFRVQQAEPL